MKENQKNFSVPLGFNVCTGEKLVVIAGPCVAESLSICREVAAEMSELCRKLDVHYIFKASFDKANRSSANSFRGLGLAEGLEILHEIRSEFKVPVLTDLHESSQAGPVAEVVDVLQIPAFLCRQTDLLIAAGQTGKPVNIKKGQFMAPEDMKGAVEKVRSTGNDKVLLTERGSSFGYHNLVVDMRSLAVMREIGVPVVFDATHSVQLPGGLGHASGGQRQFIRPLARAAAAVGLDVLFMEVHPNPDKALSDGPNSLNFADAATVLSEVKEINEFTRKSTCR
ncbi:MAG: 3-deoxy-8-phosphooctulonate synthase [Lentisphaerae bacterium GWF2_52_8]|nr:MAG: 3-deoxy-8-phosphooctulonate synthase [Lentisphaerae bacterium GWF2_52_8]